MVEQVYSLDSIFGSLSDPTRRDILKRISKRGMSVSAIARHYKFSLAGVAKHLDVLERAGLVCKSRQGKEQIVTIDPEALATANYYLENYKQLWEQRLDSLDKYLKSVN
jgi:DNA-binding transcriptional ArsR family regulator